MSTTEAEREIMDCIKFYRSRDWDFVNAITFIGIKHCFGGWRKLRNLLQPFYRRRNEGEMKHATRLPQLQGTNDGSLSGTR